MKLNSQTFSTIQRLVVSGMVLMFFASPAIAVGQSFVRIQLHSGVVPCPEQTIRLKHLANFQFGSTRQSRLATAIASVDIDAFDHGQDQIRMTKEQVKIRLLLAGFRPSQFEIVGPAIIRAAYVSQTQRRDSLESRLHQQLSNYYQIPGQDLTVTIDPKANEQLMAQGGFLAIRLGRSMPLELTPGKQTLPVVLEVGSQQGTAMNIPVTIALVRDLVVARQNISRGEVLTNENIQSVRRPVSDRNVRLVSFEHVIGKEVQSDVPQYALIKPNLVRTGSSIKQYAIRKNSRIIIIIRRGRLQLVLKDARALDNGNPGESITVVNPSTDRKVLATVMDTSTVLVRY